MTLPIGDSDALASLLTRLLGEVVPAPFMPALSHEGIEPLVDLLLYSFLLWESKPTDAIVSLGMLHDSILDTNELRVSMPDEIAEWVGLRDSFAFERAERMRAVLNAIYRREHSVTLERLVSLPKREVRDFLDGLDGMPPFVAARVTLFGFHGHAIPIDGSWCETLTREGVLRAGGSVEAAERWLERQIRAHDAEQFVLLLEGWRDAPHRLGGGSAGTPRAAQQGASMPSTSQGTDREKNSP